MLILHLQKLGRWYAMMKPVVVPHLSNLINVKVLFALTIHTFESTGELCYILLNTFNQSKSESLSEYCSNSNT